MKLRRMVAGGQKQTLTIPAHAELDVGTLKAIIRQATDKQRVISRRPNSDRISIRTRKWGVRIAPGVPEPLLLGFPDLLLFSPYL